MTLNINLQLFSIFTQQMRKRLYIIHICGRHAFTIEIVYKEKQEKLASETAIRNLLLIS